jgi:hypothetical protein
MSARHFEGDPVFDTILGLPMHPLLVHGVVVLLPLMALVTVLVAVRPAWRDKFAWHVVVANGVVLVMSFVAKESGEALLRRMTGLQISDHVRYGNLLPVTALGLTVMSGLLALSPRYPQLRSAIVVLTVFAAFVALVWASLTGHSGATAVWTPVMGG